MYNLEVGQLYMPGKADWPDSSYFNYDSAGLNLTIFGRGLTEKEIEAVRSGQVELGIYENQPSIFLLWRIRGFGPWSDSPYSIHLLPIENRPVSLEQLEEGKMLTLLITLIEGKSGIIKALRYVSTSTEFSNSLNQAVLRQLEQPFNQDEYNQHINKLYVRYTSDKMAIMTDARHKAGE